MESSSKRVFGIGLQKTGTTTLKFALEVLGYKVGGPNWKLLHEVLHNNFQRVPKFITRYDAFQDEPWPRLYQYLDRNYPNSKFILTIRDEENWLKSVKNFFGEKKHAYREGVYGASSPIGNEDLYLEVYRKHNQSVKTYFADRPEKLLVINWNEEKDIARLAEFLEVPTPKTYMTKEPIAIPQVQKGHYSKMAKARKKVKRSLIKLSLRISPKIYKQFYTSFKKWFLFKIKYKL